MKVDSSPRVGRLPLLGFLICLVSLSAIVGFSSVKGYDDSGLRWTSSQRNPHRYYLLTSVWAEWSTAVSDWSGHTDFGTIQSTASPDLGLLLVRKVDEGNSGTLAYHTPLDFYFADGYEWLLQTRITLNGYYTNQLTVSQRRQICGHELGHDLSLYDVWDWSPAQTMWWRGPDNWGRGVYTPQSNDKAGVNSIY
jgi:hypothetical protein